MYLVDADVFIEARRGDYAFDLCPGFWDWLDLAHARGQVFSIEAVRQDLLAGADLLADWAAVRTSMFLAATPDWIAHLATVAAWTQASAQYVPAAKAEFLAVTDSMLVAAGMATGFTVVTNETREPRRTSRIKIPDACDSQGVRSIGPRQMLRGQGARFILERPVVAKPA